MWSTLARHGQASQGEPNPELFRGLASRGSWSDESVAPPGLCAAGGGGAERHGDYGRLRLPERCVKRAGHDVGGRPVAAQFKLDRAGPSRGTLYNSPFSAVKAASKRSSVAAGIEGLSASRFLARYDAGLK